MTVAVDVVVRSVVDVDVVVVVVVASDEESVGVGRKTGFVRLADCVVSGAVVDASGAWLEVLLAWAVDELEADEAVEDDAGWFGTVEVRNTASLVEEAELVVAAVGIDVDAAPSVEAELADSPTELVDSDVARVVPVGNAVEVWLLPPVRAMEALVLC